MAKEIKITASSEIALIPLDFGKASIGSIHTTLDLPSGFTVSAFYKSNGDPKKEWFKMATNILCQGLVANIHAAHQSKDWDSAELLRTIIQTLENGFIQNVQAVETVNP